MARAIKLTDTTAAPSDADTATEVLTEAAPAPAELVLSSTKKTHAFKDMTTHTLAKVDLSTLDADGIAEYADVSKSRLEALSGSLFVEKHNGIVYLGTRQVGNVNRPVKATQVIPSKLKATEKHVSAGGDVQLPDADITSGLASLDNYLVAIARFSLARIHGNGINLIGQRAKTDTGVGNALASIKSGMA